MKKKYLNLFQLSLTFIKENKQRALLSIISVSIGLFSLLLVLLIGSSYINNFTGDINNTKTVELSAYSTDFIESEELLISDQVINEINNKYSGVKLSRAEPTYSALVNSEVSNLEFDDNVLITEGEDFTKHIDNVVIINNFYSESKYELNENILIDNIYYKVIGFTNSSLQQYVLPSYKIKEFNAVDNSNQLLLTFNSGLEDNEKITNEILSYLNEHIIDEKYTYEVIDLSQITNILIRAAMFIGFLFGLIILIVSLIGIINMLFVSVNERKNEIAILRSQGLNKTDISILFLMESFILIIISTILAFTCASLFSILILSFQGIGIYVSELNVIFIIIIVIIVSCLSGFLPARKASKMNISEILI